MDIKKSFGAKIKELRLDKGWSQEKLALESELDRTYIPGIEQGSRNVSITVIEKLSKGLNTSIKNLFE